ncbi:MAG: SRPBCC family protein [bacterium]
MVCKEEKLLIKRPRERVFEIAEDIKKHPEFIPKKEVEILDKSNGNNVIYWSSVNLLGIRFRYLSERSIKGDDAIKIKQIKGLLKGLETELRFEMPNHQETILKVVHRIAFPIPIIGDFIAGLIYSLFIRRMATEFLAGIKERAESENQ